MSPVRRSVADWLHTKEVKGDTLDIGGNVWSMRDRVKSFEGTYTTLSKVNTSDLIEDLDCPVDLKTIYDNVFCTEVLQFSYNPMVFLTNLHSFLGPGGRLFITFHLTHPPMKGEDYLRYTEKGARRLLQETGFKVDEFLTLLPGLFAVECSLL